MNVICYASGSSGNMYELRDGYTRILIEAGLPIKEMQKLSGYSLSGIDACYISHRHNDHCKGYSGLLNMGLYVVFAEDLKKGFDITKNIEVKTFPVPHDVPNYGFMFRSLRDNETMVFITDAFYCPVVFSFGPTIIMIECNYAHDLIGDCNYSDRLYQSHMSLKQCLETLRANDLSKCREIHLLHLSDDHSDEDRFVREVQELTGVPTFAAPKKIKI